MSIVAKRSPISATAYHLFNVANAFNNSSAVAEMGDRLATIDMGQKLGGSSAFFSWRSWVPIKHKVAWAEAYLRNKWHLDPSSHLATIDMGLKLGGSVPFLGRAGRSPFNTMSLGSRPTFL